MERVSSFKYLGVNISEDLTWTAHIQTQVKKARQRLYHLRQLRKFRVSPAILKTFYSGAIESVLTQCRCLQPSMPKEPFSPLSYQIKFTWSHKIFDAQIKIIWHISKVLYSDVTGQRSSNHFRSDGDLNVKCSNNNKYYNIYVCIIDKKNKISWLRNQIYCWTITNNSLSYLYCKHFFPFLSQNKE